MLVTYDGPAPLPLQVLLLPGEPVELSDVQVEQLRAQVGDAFLTLDVEPGPVEVPVVASSRLRADFTGSITPPRSGRTYDFLAGEPFDVDPADLPEIMALDLGPLSLVDPDFLDRLNVSTALKADLQHAARLLGLDDRGTVADLRARITAAMTGAGA